MSISRARSEGRRRHDRRPAQRLSRHPVSAGALQDRAVQPVLEDLARHRAAAAACRPVHSDELGRAAGQRAGGAAIRFRSCRTSRARCWRFRSSRTAAQGRRRLVPHRSDAVRGAGRRARRRSSSSRSCVCRRWQQLARTGSGRAFDVEQRQAEVDQLKAQVDGAKWNLDKTVVRAPADGYVTNLALRKGARVANLPLAPVMAFIDTSETIIGVEIEQIAARYVRPGQPVEVDVQVHAGQGLHRQGRHRAAGDRRADRCRPPGAAVTPKAIQSAPFVVRVKLDDAEFASRLPAGATGDRGDLHRPHQAGAHHPQGGAAAVGDPELRQSVLTGSAGRRAWPRNGRGRGRGGVTANGYFA